MRPSIAVIDYNAGNVQSVLFALEHMRVSAVLTSDHEQIRSADKVIFPGVGEASSTMRFLKAKGLDQLIPSLRQPVMGICLGLQLMCAHSEENDTPCLGILPQQVKRFLPMHASQKIPHMGWNTIQVKEDSFIPISLDGAYVYFVHSYYAVLGEHTVATTEYIHPFTACVQKDNFYACQFHLEKSGPTGLKILEHFVHNI
jgi:imidazole glycerol-phosphate synthase subunit HisH